MSDTSLPKIIQYGTNAARIAFTPSPASGSQVLYLWYETDNAPDVYAWDGSAWVQINPASGGGTVTHTGSLTADQLVLGNGTADIKPLGSAGTTTTVLHGNGAGAPSFGAVVEADITLATSNTTNDVSTTKHGFAPTLPNDATKYLDGTGNYTVPAGGGGGGSITAGTYASLPGSCAVGDMYIFTDTIYNFAVCRSTNVWTLFLDGKIAVAPGPKSGWTNVNAGSDMTVTDGAGTIDISIASNGSLNFRLITKTATPASIIGVFRVQSLALNSQSFGLAFYDGTQLMSMDIVQAGGMIRVQKWNSVTSAGSTLVSQNNFAAAQTFGGLIYMRLQNTGGTLFFDWSIDGITWHNLGSEAVGTFITPTAYGIGGVNLSTGGPLTISLESLIAV